MKLLTLSILLVFIMARLAQAQTPQENQDYSNETLKTIELPALSAEPTEDSQHALTQAIERKQLLEEKAIKIPYAILPHRPNYIMPVSYVQNTFDEYQLAQNPNWPGYSNLEAMFQVSMKYQIFQFDEANQHRLYVAYTNRSFWQLYSSNISRPFRESNHEPELLLQLTPNWGYINHLTISLNHQSNGQTTQTSRSWNRIIAGIYHRSETSVYGLEPWWRIPETDKADPDDPTDNDNPDIHQYLGYGNFLWYKKVGRESLLFRFGNNFNFEDNRSWAELEFTFPLGRRFLGFVQLYEGYGHSLIEYNRYQRRIGFGIKITDYL